MKSLCPFNCSPNPCDFGHLALGFAAAFLPRPAAIAAGAVFAGYEAARAKAAPEKARSLAQFGVGYLAGLAVPQIARGGAA